MFDAWKQRQRQRLENRPERTVFYNIFATMMLVLAVELLMAVASILAINVTGQLDENAKDLLTMRVRNRASYVQEILRNAEDLEQLSEQITATTQQLLKSGDISLDTLDNSSEQSDALLVALAPQLLDTLRTKQVTGIFLILNTHDLDTCEVGKKMPGIYLRDLDPDARPSERNSDLLLERASATVVKELAIGTDKGWQPAFPYQGDTKGGILRTVFQTAYKGDAGLSAESYGRWTTNSYCLAGDDRHAIAYSMPLILPDGTVYGVVGVELLTDYLQTKLPFTELDEDKAGTYFIVTTTDDALTDGVLTLRKTVTSGEDLVTADAPLGVLNCRSNGNGGNWVELNDKRYYMVLEPLQVYNRNAPFAAEKWFLAGTMEQSVLLAFSSRVREVLLTTIAITLVLSVLGSLLVSARLARPINRLYREVIDAQEKKTFPRLSRTAIREVDRFAETITELNKELVTNSTKFLRIMDMASVEIGGYELRTDTGSVFVTDNFFSLLGKPEMQGKPLSVRRFEEVLKGIREKNPCDHTAEGDELLTIQQPDGVRYIMLRSTIEGHAKIGLAEDVTAAVQEIMKRFHIFYGLEFVGPKHLTDSFRYPFLHDLQGVRSLADQVDPSVGILFDLFHWYTGGGTQEDILWVKAHPERIVAVHVNDAIAGRAREAQLDNERAMPMTNGVIDAVGILRIFAVGGYDGPEPCEPMDPCYTEFETMQPEQVVLCLKEAYDRLWNNEGKAGE